MLKTRNLISGMTLVMWMNIPDLYPTLSAHGILSTEHEYSTNYYTESFAIYTYKHLSFKRLGVNILSNPGNWDLVYNNNIPSGWTQIAVVYDSGNPVKVYLNGANAGTYLTPIGSTYSGIQYELVAGRQFVNVNGWYGEAIIDELLIFETALSQSQIIEIYNAY